MKQYFVKHAWNITLYSGIIIGIPIIIFAEWFFYNLLSRYEGGITVFIFINILVFVGVITTIRSFGIFDNTNEEQQVKGNT